MWFMALMNKYATFPAWQVTKNKASLYLYLAFTLFAFELEADFIYFDLHLHPLCAHLPWSEPLLFATVAFQTSFFTFPHLGNLTSQSIPWLPSASYSRMASDQFFILWSFLLLSTQKRHDYVKQKQKSWLMIVNAFSYLLKAYLPQLTFFHCKSHHSISPVIEVQQIPEKKHLYLLCKWFGAFFVHFYRKQTVSAVINASIWKQANLTLSSDVMCSV